MILTHTSTYQLQVVPDHTCTYHWQYIPDSDCRADWRRDVGWLSRLGGPIQENRVRPSRTHRLGLSAAKCGGGGGGGWSARSPEPGRLPAGSHRIRAQPARYFKTSPPPRSRWQRRPKTLGESSGPRRFPRAELESPSRRVEPRGRGSVPTPGHGNRPEGQGPPEAAAQRVNARRPSLRGRLRLRVTRRRAQAPPRPAARRPGGPPRPG
jgi:hypothetical protein